MNVAAGGAGACALLAHNSCRCNGTAVFGGGTTSERAAGRAATTSFADAVSAVEEMKPAAMESMMPKNSRSPFAPTNAAANAATNNCAGGGKKRPRLAVRFAPALLGGGDADAAAPAASQDRADADFVRIMEVSDEAIQRPDAPSEADGTTDAEDASFASASTEEDDHNSGVLATILGPGSPNFIDMSDPAERALIWYSPEEIGSFKSSARTLASWIKKSEAQRSEDRNSCGGDAELLSLLRMYRERFDRRGGSGGAAEDESAEIGEGLVRLGLIPLELSHLDPRDVSEHRGLEFRASFERQRNKFIALRAVVTYMDRLRREADKRGVELTEYPSGKIAYVSNKVTRWSRNLARKEGLEDFRAAYPHIVPREEVRKQAALSGVQGTGGSDDAHEFPLKWKKRKSPSDDSISDDLSSMMSCDMSLSKSSHSDEVSLSSMKSNMSIQSSYIKVKPFFEAVAEEQELQQQQQQQGHGQVQQEEPKRRRRRGPSFTKGVAKGVTKALLGKKLSSSS